MTQRRLFVVVPAAGLSRRMGRHKLLLKVGDATVIRRLLDAVQHEAVAARIVVMRRSDSELLVEVSKTGASIVLPPVDPPHMRTSVQHGLDFIREHFAPDDQDGWMLVPADHPVLDASLVASLIENWKKVPDRIVVPAYRGKRGHPTIFPWTIACEVGQLPEEAGLNVLIQSRAQDVVEIEVESSTVLTDLDTPEDFEALRRQFESELSD